MTTFPRYCFWDGDEKVELPRCGFGMELWDEVSRDEALGGAEGMKLPR